MQGCDPRKCGSAARSLHWPILEGAFVTRVAEVLKRQLPNVRPDYWSSQPSQTCQSRWHSPISAANQSYSSHVRVFPDRPQFPRQHHDQEKSRGRNEEHGGPEAKIVIDKGDGSPHPCALCPSVFELRELIANKGRKWRKCDGDYQNHAAKGAHALIHR